MARHHYRELAVRFAHIDAEFLDFAVTRAPSQATLRVRFYPWWEHPAYLAAIAEGRPWGFTDAARDAAIVVSVHAHGVRTCQITPSEITDWAFPDTHPLLLSYEPRTRLLCNSHLSPEMAVGLIQEIDAISGRWFSAFRHLNPPDLATLVSYGASGSFALGSLPASMAARVRSYLTRNGVDIFEPYPVPSELAERLPRLLLLDGQDFVIADDFEAEVPDVEHRPEYFDASL